MTTRTITGTVRHATGQPWVGAAVTFSLVSGQWTTTDNYPQDSYVLTKAWFRLNG